MSQYRADKNRYEFVTRKLHDNAIDRLKEVNGRHKAAIRKLQKKLDTLEEFMELGPHNAAWQAFLAAKCSQK